MEKIKKSRSPKQAGKKKKKKKCLSPKQAGKQVRAREETKRKAKLLTDKTMSKRQMAPATM